MGYGKDTVSCTLMVIWCSQLERVIIEKIGSMLKFQGTITVALVTITKILIWKNVLIFSGEKKTIRMKERRGK